VQKSPETEEEKRNFEEKSPASAFHENLSRNDGENAAFAPFAIAADFAPLTAPVNPDATSVANTVF